MSCRAAWQLNWGSSKGVGLIARVASIVEPKPKVWLENHQ